MIKKLILLAVCSLIFVVTPSVNAQRPSVEFEEPTASPGEQSSGFYDKETGKTLTIDEYNAYREEAAKGVYEKYPIPATLVTVAIIGGGAYLVVRWRKRKVAHKPHNQAPTPPPAPQAPHQQPPAAPNPQ